MFHSDANDLLRLILINIGDRYGAINDFFRPENKAHALPPKPKSWIPEIEEIGSHFPLRLYCYRISTSIVVLFNGGYKDAPTAQLSPDVRLHFFEAQQLAERIKNALKEGMIQISMDGRYLSDFQNNTEIIL